jgi:hypothetical protein
MRSRSRHSARRERTTRSATALAFGVFGGVLTIVIPSDAKTASKLAGNLPSRSRMRKRKG